MTGVLCTLPLPRFLFLAVALFALAVLVVGDGVPPARAQQTPTVLVSNIGQTPATSPLDTGSWSNAQEFTTGATSGGYALGSIEAVVGATNITQAQRDTIRAELWSATDSGSPGMKIADLAVPAHPISTGTVSFAAPADTTLAASTTYYAVFYTVGSFSLNLSGTASDSEDSGSAAGWSIANGARSVQVDVPVTATTWPAQGTDSLRITVKGSEAQTTSVDLGSLTAESTTDGNNFTALALSPAFAAATTAYRATVGNGVTHVRLTPTLADTGSSVQVGKSSGTLATVNSGSASTAIALDVGDNAITVRVTDADSNSQDYTVTVHRAPADTLVSNTGQFTSEDNYASTDSYVIAQGFTTGTVSGGYTLTSIEAFLVDDASAAESGKFRAELWSAATSGGPSAKVADLTVPSDMPQGIVSFAAPASTALTASTTYYLLLYTTDSTELAVDLTEMEGEDAGGQAGWAIENVAYAQIQEQPVAGQVWAVYAPTSGLLKLRVRGAAGVQGPRSSNANLGGLTASGSATSTGTFTAFPLSPAFSAAATSYTATVPNTTAYARLTPTVADTGKATVMVGPHSGTLAPVADTQDSAALALAVGSNNVFTVRVTAEDSTTRDYTVTITRQTSTTTPTQPTVSISASPTDVDEGSPVTVTLTLSEALSSSVTVPLTITDGSAEPRDHGRLASITIPANSTTATGTITTRHDSDIRDETFTVSLGTLSSETGTVSLEALPPELAAGSPSSVEITILDDDYPIDTVPDLPIDYSKQRPASERQPTGEGAGSSFCYLGSGNGTTEYIRYSDGRIAETTKQSDAIRSMFACD